MTKTNSNYDATDLGWWLQTELELFGHRNTDGIGPEIHMNVLKLDKDGCTQAAVIPES